MTTTVLNTKINEVENKIPDTSILVTTTVLNRKITEVEDKTLEFNKVTADNFKERFIKLIF